MAAQVSGASSALPALGDLFNGSLVRLGALGKDDTKTIQQWNQQADYGRLLDDDPHRLLSVLQLEREFARDVGKNKDEIDFGIRTLADNQLIGFCSIEPIWSHRGAWVAIGIGSPQYRGKGYGTDAMRLLVGYGFRELDLQRITLNVFGYNQRAMRSYEKVGFIHEVTQRAALYRDGQRHDILVMGLLRREWEDQQARHVTTLEETLRS